MRTDIKRCQLCAIPEQTWWEKVLETWEKLLHKLRITWLLERINSSLYWAKVGWGIHDWDSGYGLVVLEAYMKRMDKCLTKYGHHAGTENDLRRIHEFRHILHRLIENDYDLSIYQDGEWKHITTPDTVPGSALVAFVSPPLKTMLFLTEDERWKYGENQRKQDWEYVGMYLKKYFDGWWD